MFSLSLSLSLSKLISLNNTLTFVAPWISCGRKLTLSVSCVRYAKIKATNPISELPLTCFCGVAENLLCQVRLYIGDRRQDADPRKHMKIMTSIGSKSPLKLI